MFSHWDTAALEMPNSLARALAEPALAMISDLLIEAPLRCNVNDSLQKSNTYKKISLQTSLVALTFIPCPSNSAQGLLRRNEMSKTLQTILETRPWVAHIDDERNDGNSIIVSLAKGWFFADEQDCGVRGFDTVAEVKAATSRKDVVQKTIYLRA